MNFKKFIPAILWHLVSLLLMCLPGSTIPVSPWLEAIHADKLVHIGMFGLLCLLWCLAFSKLQFTGTRRRQYFLLILTGCIVYGTAMEFVQKYWVSNRSFELGDIAADSVGAIGGYIAALWWLGRVGKKIGPDRNRDRNQN